MINNDGVLFQELLKIKNKINKCSIEKEKQILQEKYLEYWHELYNRNQYLVINVAKQNLDKGLKLEELLDEGNKGLINALESFNDDKGFSFVEYANMWINYEIEKALSNQSEFLEVSHEDVNKEGKKIYGK